MVKTVIYILQHLKKTQNLDTSVKFAACMSDVSLDALVEATVILFLSFLFIKYLSEDNPGYCSFVVAYLHYLKWDNIYTSRILPSQIIDCDVTVYLITLK